MEYEEKKFSELTGNNDDYYSKNFFTPENKIYNDKIKTVIFKPTVSSSLMPAFSLNKGEIHLNFDDFHENINEYFYKIIHCDVNWNISSLPESKYLNGINGLPIYNYEFSSNTSAKYLNYQLSIPNQDIQLTRTGNYLLYIYAIINGTKTSILSRRFVVFDQFVEIVPQLRKPTGRDNGDTKQEIDFTINHPNFSFFNPHTDVEAVVLQNGNWRNAVYNLRPVFIRENQLIFDFSGKCVFEGGNEFRVLDLKSTIGGNERIERQEKRGNTFEVFLRGDILRARNPHIYYSDNNGRFFINNWFRDNSNVSSEYLNVHFSLPYEQPISHGNIYLNGLFTDWCCNETYKMNYNYQKKAYEKTIKLKQGLYNYEYIFLEDGRETGTSSLIEGSFFETDNEYSILVYYKNTQEMFHNLIGYLTFTTR